MDNASHKQHLSTFMSAFHSFTVTVKDTIIDEKERKVSMWASSRAETDIGSYENEYTLILKCDEDGKVVWIGEFLDTQYTVAFFAKLREYLGSRSREGQA